MCGRKADTRSLKTNRKSTDSDQCVRKSFSRESRRNNGQKQHDTRERHGLLLGFESEMLSRN